MAGMPWATRMWPGLPRIWSLGSWSGLAQAFGFTVAVNLAVLGSFYWVELLPGKLLTLVWSAIGLVWVSSALFSRRESSPPRLEQEDEDGGQEDSFAEAIEHYLRGNWYEAQRVLSNLLRRDPRDLEAGLMWATVLRHAGRAGEANEQLDRLECFDGHQKWGPEIRRERELLQQLSRKSQENAGENSSQDSTAEAA